MIKQRMTICGLTILLLISIANAQEIQRVYFIELDYNLGNLNLLNVKVVPGYPSVSTINDFMPYSVELTNLNEEVIYKGYFDIPVEIDAVPPLPGEEPAGDLILEKVQFPILIPYSGEGQKVNIYKESNPILTIDVSMYSLQEMSREVEKPFNFLMPLLIVLLILVVIIIASPFRKKNRS